MLNSKSFLAVDFGAGSLKLAEFEVNEAGGLRLKHYGFESLGPEGSQETTREAVVLKALQKLMAEKGVKSRNVNVCAPGFHVFSKFVKLPPVDAGKVTQIIQYEAQQNVPFPLEEVVWDYQILGSTPAGELEVLLVAIKADIVEGLFRTTEAVGLRLQLCDVSPAALCNAFRYNYGDLEDCTMLLDIGAKTSNLLFFEKGKVFSRSINLGANSITQDFANESKKKFDAAEKIKIAEGFVSLGGAYEEPENPDQAAISKIARQFMTRLHIQVNQTMQFYRGQQGGSAPARLFLSGGASIMPYTAQFFAEKLNVPVEYFNPLRNVQIDPSINLEELARVAHSMGEIIGLGLRNLAHCPVELNLMPESTLNWQSFNQKKPYLIASVFSLVAVVAAVGLLFDKLAGAKDDALQKVHNELPPQEQKRARFEQALSDLKKTQRDADQIIAYLDDRYYWPQVMSELKNVLVKVEDRMKTDLGAYTGVWIENFKTAEPRADSVDVGSTESTSASEYAERMRAMEQMRKRYGLAMRMPGLPAAPAASADTGGDTSVHRKKGAGTNDVSSITITFRAVSLENVKAGANKEIVYAVLGGITSNPLFDPDPAETKDTGNIGAPEDPGTFTFKLIVGLKRQLSL
jgi:type IV pilus assembly protein PilM